MDATFALKPAESAALTRRVTALSVAVATVLTALKVGVWLETGSVAILASMADSGLDLIAALGTFMAVRYAASPPDAEHRYGHGKAEAFASLVQAGLVFASAALIGQEAFHHILHPTAITAEGSAMGVMGVSVLMTSGLVYAQSRVLKTATSVAVSGDRAHYFADLASNLVALAGIGLAAALHSAVFDAAAGLIVAAWLVWGAISVFRQSSLQLMDHELDDASRARIVRLMTQNPAIKDIHQLRTRAAGPIVHIQMHADLDPTLSLVAAHALMVEAEKRVLEAFPSADIIIHPDPRGQAEPHGGAFAEAEEVAERTG